MDPDTHPNDVPEIEGLIEATLPKGLFRVRLDNGTTVRASVSAKARKIIIKVIPGNRVLVKVHPHDPTRGRITQQIT